MTATNENIKPENRTSIRWYIGILIAIVVLFIFGLAANICIMNKQFKKNDWTGATWPPNLVPKKLWNLVGGYSTEFSPGMYSDPDFSMKLWNAGVRNFKGVSKSRVYHFMSKSTKKINFKKFDGRRIFFRKWGVSSNVFTTHYLKRGRNWSGPLGEPIINLRIRLKVFLTRIKLLFQQS